MRQRHLRGRGEKLQVVIDKSVRAEILKAAKESFPSEYLGFLIGHDGADEKKAYVFDVHHSDYSSELNAISEGSYYAALADARAYAREVSGMVIGDVHSHPYQYDGNACSMECAPSETDMQMGMDGVMAICVVRQNKNKSLSTRLKFYPPFKAIEEVYV